MTDLPKSLGAGKQTAPSVFFGRRRKSKPRPARDRARSGKRRLFKEPGTAQSGTYVPCLCCKNYWLQFIHNFSKMFLVTRSAGVSEWQTRETQNLLLETTCGFESRRRHPWQGQYGPLSCEIFSWLGGLFLYELSLQQQLTLAYQEVRDCNVYSSNFGLPLSETEFVRLFLK